MASAGSSPACNQTGSGHAVLARCYTVVHHEALSPPLRVGSRSVLKVVPCSMFAESRCNATAPAGVRGAATYALTDFAVLLERRGDACELDGLFVEPDRMRSGVGRRLVEDAKRIAGERGATRIDVVANPQAVAFYEAVGFKPAGEAQTRFGWAPRMSLAVAP
jgi:GNAT superfamily N-acetyltransferase